MRVGNCIAAFAKAKVYFQTKQNKKLLLLHFTKLSVENVVTQKLKNEKSFIISFFKIN
jgi:hypothetical protein